MAAKLTVGEQQLNSQLIDGFRYTGVNLANDERMLPPSLQGYAPEVSGIAKTNAKVTISQSGRILYETNVPAGPFRIQGLDSSVRGRLDVRVEEQDGSVNSFQVDTATVPYLTRPGYVRYNLAVGAPSEQTDSVHDVHGPAFVTGDFSWGWPTPGRCTVAAWLRVNTTPWAGYRSRSLCLWRHLGRPDSIHCQAAGPVDQDWPVGAGELRQAV